MFREYFKYYKSKWPTPDFKNVIDFRETERGESEEEVTNFKLVLYHYRYKSFTL